MLLSIIIPMYNVEKYIERCVSSCKRQNFSEDDFEIIIINDGSSDNSLKIAETITKDFVNVKIISQPNGGLSAARNTGMRNANGDYYMFVDSDDWIAEDCLGNICEKLNTEHPDVLCICAANVYENEFVRRQSYNDETPISGCELLKKGISPCAPFGIWSAHFMSKYNLSFYEGIYHEDSELTPRAYYLAEKVSFVNDIIYFVRQNPNSITRTPNPKRSFDLVKIVCNHLSDFSVNVKNEYKYIFYNMVSLYLNNALAYILDNSKNDQNRLDEIIYENRQLFLCLKKSSLIKYRLEAHFFELFPKHYVKIYRIMKFKF